MATLEQSAQGSEPAETQDGVRRRDFLNVAAVSFAGVGVVAVTLPLISQMSPPADVLALAQTEVDISKIATGQAIKTVWRKQPVFIRNLTAQEIQAANSVPASELRDPQTLAERTKPGKQNWLITLGFCPCHGSAYDTAARIRSGPAPTNLLVPDYEFISDTTVRIG
jgi:ubiquinol-cytochrome c reductase iron-sulfur subunit